VITVTLYIVVFGKLVGNRIGIIAGGFSYMQYIVPGLVMMNVITNSYGNISSSFFGAKFQRSVEEMLVSPMPNWVILLGYVLGAVARGLAVGLLALLIALFFTALHMVHPLITALSVLLGAAIFSLAGFVNAMYAKKFDDVALVPTFVLTPLTYLGGVFYPVRMLGEPWQTISRINPIVYMVNAFRYGVLGVSDVSIGASFAVMLVFVIGLAAFALFLLKRGIGLRS
jgi:ABC-2 type transport system permease protein